MLNYRISYRPTRIDSPQYIHDGPNNSHTLSLLPTIPPTPSLAVGTTTQIPPTPQSFKENHTFTGILHTVLSMYAIHDPFVKSQAQAMASAGGSTLGSGGQFFPSNHPSQQAAHRDKRSRPARSYGGGGGTGGDGAGGASAQGGAGGAGVGGWVHVSDMRNPPDYGRIAWPEDIFGSVEVDGQGRFVGDNGGYQDSGSYRICTNEGILGLSPFLMAKLRERLQELERQQKSR